MKINEINVRDPFILLHNDTYYMYGSRGWDFTGFDVYTSQDLENWSEAKSVFEKPEDFWGTKEYWAPEVHKYKGKFYMFASFNSDNRRRGIQILVSDTPDGTFVVHSKNPITPPDMEALDGTLYIAKDGGHGMLFTDKSGKLNFIMHSPNRPKFAERPVLKEVVETKDGFLKLK